MLLQAESQSSTCDSGFYRDKVNSDALPQKLRREDFINPTKMNADVLIMVRHGLTSFLTFG